MRPGNDMNMHRLRRHKAGALTLGPSPVRPHPGTLSGAELRRIVAEMVD